MSVREIMTTEVISVTRDTTLEGVMDLLSRHKFSGVPVTDQDKKVIGMLSEKDIVNFAEREKVMPFTMLSGWISPNVQLNDIASLRKGMELLSKTAVEKVMTRDVVTVNEDTPVTEAARIMNNKEINRLPVVNDNGRLVGIITRADLVKYLADKEKYLR